MNRHVRIVSALWVVVGIALAAWGVWGLATEGHETSVALSWLFELGFAALATAAGLTFVRGTRLGRLLVRTVSVLALVYSLAWLFLGGIDDASGYAPAILAFVALSIYGLAASNLAPRAA